MQNNIKQYLDEALSCIDFLNQQINNIDQFEDKSLFFQNPQILDGWFKLYKSINKFEHFDSSAPKPVDNYFYAQHLLSLYKLKKPYCEIYLKYVPYLNRLLILYKNNLEENCYSEDILNTIEEKIKNSYYKHDKCTFEDWSKNLNILSVKARKEILFVIQIIYSSLKEIIDAIEKIFEERFPTDEDMTNAIQEHLREYTKGQKEYELKEMNEDLNRFYKVHPTDPNTPELWGEMLRADEKAMSMAIKGELSKCDNPKQQHWHVFMKEVMDKNSSLLERISKLCYTNHLFDLTDPNIGIVLCGLTEENFGLFCNLIVRRNLIQCEMFPELKAQHEEWLNPSEKQDQEENERINPTFSLPNELATDQAMIFWQLLVEKGFVDNNYHLLNTTTRQQAMYIAEAFAEKLKIRNKWKVFEDFWGRSNLAQEKWTLQQTGAMPNRYQEIDAIFED